jgi:hypothetical protein
VYERIDQPFGGINGGVRRKGGDARVIDELRQCLL